MCVFIGLNAFTYIIIYVFKKKKKRDQLTFSRKVATRALRKGRRAHGRSVRDPISRCSASIIHERGQPARVQPDSHVEKGKGVASSSSCHAWCWREMEPSTAILPPCPGAIHTRCRRKSAKKGISFVPRGRKDNELREWCGVPHHPFYA
jgi:hypothetical protein